MLRESRRISIGFSLLVVLSIVFAATPALAQQPIGFLECPDVDFTADPTSGYAPLEVHFTNETTWETECSEQAFLDLGVLAEVLGMTTQVGCGWRTTWDFGDGSTEVADAPTHVYTRPGQYSVTLTYEFVCVATGSFLPLVDIFRANPNPQPQFEVYSATKNLYITVIARAEEEKDDAPPEPAKMLSAHLDVNPTEVVPGQEVIISANVCNSGGESGVKTATLFVNGTAEQSQTVGVGPGGCTTVVFRVSKGAPGTYQVNVDGMPGAFSVLAPRIVQKNVPSQQDTGLGTAGLIAIAVVLVVLLFAVVVILKKE